MIPDAADRSGRMNCMSSWDIHMERMETIRKLALDRLQNRNSYHCPDCGYQGNRMDCPRCGEACESMARRRS